MVDKWVAVGVNLFPCQAKQVSGKGKAEKVLKWQPYISLTE